MKTTKTILFVLLVLSGLMPLTASVFSAVAHEKIAAMFHLVAVPTPDVDKLIVIMGSAMVANSIFQFLAASWVRKGMIEGFYLAFWLGVSLMIASAYMYVFFGMYEVADASLCVIDFIKGAAIFILSMILIRERKANQHVKTA